MSRLQTFESYKTHPWLSKIYSRLSAEEIATVRAFIATNDHLKKGEFMYVVNRMFLDQPAKPRRWKEIMELLTCVDSSVDD